MVATKPNTARPRKPKDATKQVDLWKSPNPSTPPAPANGWYSLLTLIDYYSPATLATVIEKRGIYVIDSVGRIAKASSGTDALAEGSKSNALNLLEEVRAELDDPGPEGYSWRSPRWELEEHPLSPFGWTDDQLPTFQEPEEGIPLAPNDIPWAQLSFEELNKIYLAAGSYTWAAKRLGVSRQAFTKIYHQKRGAHARGGGR